MRGSRGSGPRAFSASAGGFPLRARGPSSGKHGLGQGRRRFSASQMSWGMCPCLADRGSGPERKVQSRRLGSTARGKDQGGMRAAGRPGAPPWDFKGPGVPAGAPQAFSLSSGGPGARPSASPACLREGRAGGGVAASSAPRVPALRPRKRRPPTALAPPPRSSPAGLARARAGAEGNGAARAAGRRVAGGDARRGWRRGAGGCCC